MFLMLIKPAFILCVFYPYQNGGIAITYKWAAEKYTCRQSGFDLGQRPIQDILYIADFTIRDAGL
jgi:hypothetical protein